jgi:hypothetical protein
VETAAGRYGGAWVEAVAARTRQVADGYRQAGMSAAEVAARFADPQGQPALDSPGGRDVVRGLPADVCGTLNTAQGRAGVQAVVGDVVAPRFTRDRAAIAGAVGGAVGLPRERQGDPAGDAAAALSARPEDLGGYYGSVGRFVALARGRGLDGATARQVVAGAAGGRRVDAQVADTLHRAGLGEHEARGLIRAAQLLPERLEITAAELPVAA